MRKSLSKILFFANMLWLVFAASCSAAAVNEPALSTPTSPTLTFTVAPTSTFTPSPTVTSTSTLTPTPRPSNLTKFEPPDGQVLVFVGQDNESVGGNSSYRDGYVDTIGIPAGITTYTTMAEDGLTLLGQPFERGHMDGLLSEADWGAGPVCAACYLDSPQTAHAILHISISMAGGNEYLVADGTYDYQIDELSTFLQSHRDHPFFLRIGYEFDSSANQYDHEAYKKAFRRIVDHLRADGLTNFATVFSSGEISVGEFFLTAYYPGDDYVDWIGYSYWNQPPEYKGALDFARAHNKPVIIAESAPPFIAFGQADGEKLWNDWFIPYFQHIMAYPDTIKAISYINCNWSAQPMWQKRVYWLDTRLQTNEILKQKWLTAMNTPIFINGDDDVYGSIGFSP